MIKPRAIEHIVLRTDRYQELIEFYCHVLGCEVECGEFQKRYGAQGMGRSIYLQDIVGNNIELRSFV